MHVSVSSLARRPDLSSLSTEACTRKRLEIVVQVQHEWNSAGGCDMARE